MKNILSIFAIFALLFTACEPVDPQDANQQIKLITNDTVNVGSGSAMGLIQYEILDMIQGAEVKAEAPVQAKASVKRISSYVRPFYM